MKYTFVEPKPMAHQIEGLKALIENKGVQGLLFDPGTGKTRVVLDYLGMLYLKHGRVDALICAPLDALDTWPDQADLWLPPEVKAGLELHMLDSEAGTILDKAERILELANTYNRDKLRIVIVNHDAFKYRHKVKGLKTVTVQDRIVDAVTKWRPDIAVYDESHRALKTATSNTTSAWRKIGRVVDRRIIMTGTVSPKHPLDVFGQWLFLNPRRFGEKWGMFRYTYAVYGGYLGREILKYKNLSRLWRTIDMDATVVSKDEALDLPPLTEVKVPVHLAPRERKAYLSMANDFLVELEERQRDDPGKMAIAPTTLTKILRLRQICGGSINYTDEETAEVRPFDIGDSKIRVCVSKVEGLVGQDEKIVVFAHFVRDIHRLTAAVNDALNGRRPSKDPIPVYGVTGAIDKPTRRVWRKEFYAHDGPAVFIAQMRTMSLAINEFTAAANVIFFSMSERRDDYDQAKDRLHRQGQTRPVTAYHLVVPHSVDDALLESHREKKRLEHVITGRANEILTLGEGS